MPAENKKAPIERVGLKVTGDNHTHAGKPVKKGATIQVTQKDKEFLEKEWAKKQ